MFTTWNNSVIATPSNIGFQSATSAIYHHCLQISERVTSFFFYRHTQFFKRLRRLQLQQFSSAVTQFLYQASLFKTWAACTPRLRQFFMRDIYHTLLLRQICKCCFQRFLSLISNNGFYHLIGDPKIRLDLKSQNRQKSTSSMFLC